MNPAAALTPDGAHVGNVGGWYVSFHEVDGPRLPKETPFLEFGCEQYYGDAHVVLPSGLDGGLVELTVEGITNSDYSTLKSIPSSRAVGRLYLYWRDTPDAPTSWGSTLGMLDITGPPKAEKLTPWQVIDFSVDAVHRTIGPRRVQLTITGHEHTFWRMTNARLTREVKAADPKAGLDALMTELKLFPVAWHGLAHDPRHIPAAAETPGSTSVTFAAGKNAVSLLRDLEPTLRGESGRLGRGHYLMRAGQVQVGVRPIPFDGTGTPTTWAASGGVVAVEAEGTVLREGAVDADLPESSRRAFKITSRGRPDIRPGDVVTVGIPEEDAPPVGGWGAVGQLVSAFTGPIIPTLPGIPPTPSVQLYLHSVEHRIGRTSAFTTIARGVEVTMPTDVWDVPPKLPAGTRPPLVVGTGGPAALAAAQAVKAVVSTAAAGTASTTVAEVRGAPLATATDGPPPQSSLVWRGLDARDNRAGGARRHSIARPTPSSADDVPYLTPVALPGCGLVLPRYPGTRVVVDHVGGSTTEPVDTGAFWRAGEEPKKTEPGDYWLILPVGYQSPKQASGDGPVTPHSGNVTHDLIAADGSRTIQVGTLTVRVGKAATTAVGERPTVGTAGAVTIEHADGNARIVIDDKGAITIEGASIAFKATGDITMDAANVKVGVTGTMDVS